MTTSQDGKFEGEIRTEIPEGLESCPAQTFRDTFQGCGWLVGGDGIWDVDERHDPVSVGPIPIFRGVCGSGEMRVVPDPSTRCVLADAWDVADADALASRGWTVQNMSRIRELDSCFPDGSPRIAPIASHLNAATWISPLPPGNRGVRLRRFYDRFHGRQRARVKVDGEPVGLWYEPVEDRVHRWGISEFGIAAEHTAGKSSIAITIDPPPGTSLWSVSRFEVWALVSL